MSEFMVGVHQVRPEDLTYDIVKLVADKSRQPIDPQQYMREHSGDLAIFIAEDVKKHHPLGILAVAPVGEDTLEITAHAISSELNGQTREVTDELLARCSGLAKLIGRETVEIDTRYVECVDGYYIDAGFEPLAEEPNILVKAA